MRKVIYRKDRQVALAKVVIAAWVDTMKQLVEEGFDSSDLAQAGAAWALGQAMLDYHLCFKDPTFREEKEWRLIKLVNTTSEIKRMGGDLPKKNQLSPVISMYPPEGIDILFRQSAYGFTPYVEVAATNAKGRRVPIPIAGVRRGPREHAEIVLKSLEL